MKRMFIVAALVAAAAVAEAQQMPPGKWWRRPEVIRQLELTNGQQNQLDEVFRAAANELIDNKAAVDKLQVALRAEIDRAELRRGEIRRIAADLTAARGRLFERELLMLIDMRAVLNEPQWNRLRQFLDAREAGVPMNRPNRPRGRRPN